MSDALSTDLPTSPCKDPQQEAIRLTRYILHKHYCENDVKAIIDLLDEDDCFSWFGAAEHEYAIGSNTVAGIFREFKGKVLKCRIREERYDVIEPAPHTYLVTGTYWVETDPSTNALIRVHQRIAMGFRTTEQGMRCFHIHLSNPYVEMAADDVGFPTKMTKHSYAYLQEQIEEQKRKLDEQSKELSSIYSTVPCVIMRMLRTSEGFKPLMINPAAADLIGISTDQLYDLDWSGGYCPYLAEEDAEMARQLMTSLREPGDRVDMIAKMERANGETMYVSSNNELVDRTEEGDVIQKIAFDISERIVLEQALERQSYEDSLTGLFNRNKFNREMRDSAYVDAPRLGVAYFDTNGLKETNDSLGHRAGDELICRSAEHIRKFFDGKAYRIGGDEFVIIDTESSREAFMSNVEKAHQAMEDDGISISAGASYRNTACNIEAQFEEADRRMYRAKGEHYRGKGDARHRR